MSLYIAACILIPAIWGLAVAAIYDALAARKKRDGAGDPPDLEP